MRDITFTPGAYTDYLNWLETDRKMFLKITSLIRESAKTPESGAGKPERLKHDYKGYWSRRINEEHRLVYYVTETYVKIVSCRYHYK